MRCVGYMRVSDPNDEGTSLATQEARIREHAATQGYQMVGVYSDLQTGATYRDRPGLSELRALVRAGAVDVVLAYAIDRLARHQAHVYIIAEEASDHGARLEFVTEDFEDSAVGRFIRGAKAFAAEVEREKIAERTMRGKRARVQAGRLLPGPVPPYGLLPNADRSGWLPNDELVPIVQRIFRELVDEGLSLRAICMGLARDGIPTATGRPRWSAGTLANILRNPAYAGVVAGWRWAGGRLHTDPADYIIATHCTSVQVIDTETFRLAQARLSASVPRPRLVKHPGATLLRGACRCGSCGRALVVSWSAGRAAYRCASHGDPSRVCPSPVKMSARKLDRIAWAYAQNLIARPEGINHVRADPHGAEARLARADKALAAIDRERARVMRELTATDDPDLTATWRAALADVAERRRTLNAERIAAVAAADAARRTVRRSHEAREAALRLAGDGSDPEARRAAILALGILVEVWPRDRQPRWVVYQRE